tara:strand:- start:319 stop:1179 length:861 start_codon:yes stop_codon:yes gene_type:complete
VNDFVNAFIKIIDLFLNPRKNGFAVLVALIGLTITYFGYSLFVSGIQDGGAALTIAYGDGKEFDLGKGGPGLIFCVFGMGLIVFSIYNYSKIRASPDSSNCEEIDGLVEIHPRTITKEFNALLLHAGRWRYKGNFGRYMRGKVLPTLASKANFHISVCIIDPTNPGLCEEHARYRNSINSIDKGKKYNADNVALEVVVTIIVCAWYVANKNVAIDLYLSSVFDPVRIDANDHAMILTVEDRRSPALKITSGHFMFEHFDLQMQFSRQQAKNIKVTGLRESETVATL